MSEIFQYPTRRNNGASQGTPAVFGSDYPTYRGGRLRGQSRKHVLTKHPVPPLRGPGPNPVLEPRKSR
jgi:hypothetical protein